MAFKSSLREKISVLIADLEFECRFVKKMGVFYLKKLGQVVS